MPVRHADLVAALVARGAVVVPATRTAPYRPCPCGLSADHDRKGAEATLARALALAARRR